MNKFIYTICLLFIISSLSFATNGTYLNGFSAASVGRGGTSYGFADSPTLIMRNPASLAFASSSSLEASFSALIPKLHFKNDLNDKDSESLFFPMGDLAYVNKPQNSPFSWGLALFTQGGMGSDFKLAHALFSSEQEYHSSFGVVELGPSVAYRLSDKLSIGASVHYVYGMMEMWMPFSLPPSVMNGTAQPGMTFGQMFGAPQAQGGLGYSEVTAFARMEELTANSFNGNIGLQYQVSNKLTIGATYTISSSLKLENGTAGMDMTAQFNDAFGRMVSGALLQMGIDPSMATQEEQQQAQQAVQTQLGQLGIDLSKGVAASYNVTADLTLPAIAGIGAAYRLNDAITLGADVEYIFWKDAFDKMALSFSNGSNANVNTLLGSSSLALVFPLQWENTIVIKLGAEALLLPNLTGRLGFIHGSNPVPDETVFPVFPAIVEDHITAGFSYAFSNNLGFSFAYELALNNSQTSDANILASEYVGSTSELMEHLFHVSIGVGL